jgi:hypothetical protein
MGQRADAEEHYRQAIRWFGRYGDEAAVRETRRALIQICLEEGDLQGALPLLSEGDQYAMEHPEDRTFLCHHLLDRSAVLLQAGRHGDSVQAAFQALAAAEGLLAEQSQAHLLLCRGALAKNRPADALGFALAARVAAIDGREYQLEFEASTHLFDLLRQHGTGLLKQIEGEYLQAGVDLYHYLSAPALKRFETREER